MVGSGGFLALQALMRNERYSPTLQIHQLFLTLIKQYMVQLADQSGVSVLHSRRDRREPFLPGGKERAEGEGQGKGKARVSTWKRRRWLAWLTRRRGGRRRMAVTLFAEFQPHPSPHEEKKPKTLHSRARSHSILFSDGSKAICCYICPPSHF